MGKTTTTKKKKPTFIGLDKNGRPDTFPYVQTSSSSIHNRGLFAAKTIPQDEYVIQYIGERITKKTSTRRGVSQYEKSIDENFGSVYIFEIDDTYDIDGNFDWNLARLANHSCNPNCEAHDVEGEIWLVSLQKIEKGEELTFDYGYAVEHWEEHLCRCESNNCIGHIVRKEDWSKLKELKQAQTQ